ncbi:Phenylacetaldehyde reductase (2-phenylethanol synthase) [Durusdinium trenchii]|uniref:Phenylacetaldehyde reductase (2-phenylethanol synthase) n=1 Tax=Durusdinium trenchii TaxID=1381693 RepID=A0ABP0LKN2_9DINO
MGDAGAAVVAVTGASGFLGAWLVAVLVDQGFRVRGTVRDVDAASKWLPETLPEHARGRLELFQADLLKKESFDEAFSGADFVVHAAAPVSTAKPRNPQKVLIEPMVKGTANVLQAAARAGTVKRVVMTSSTTAVSAGPLERGKHGNHMYTAEDWSTVSIKDSPYAVGKRSSEQAAWDLAEKLDLELVTILPGIMFGPCKDPNRNNTGTNLIRAYINGSYPVVVNLSMPSCDVETVAKLHAAALQTPSAAGNRYLVAQESTIRDLLNALRSSFPDRARKLPRWFLPKPVAKVMSHCLPLPTYLARQIDVPWTFDYGPAQQDLGFEPSDLGSVVCAVAKQLIDEGDLSKSKNLKF